MADIINKMGFETLGSTNETPFENNIHTDNRLFIDESQSLTAIERTFPQRTI